MANCALSVDELHLTWTNCKLMSLMVNYVNLYSYPPKLQPRKKKDTGSLSGIIGRSTQSENSNDTTIQSFQSFTFCLYRSSTQTRLEKGDVGRGSIGDFLVGILGHRLRRVLRLAKFVLSISRNLFPMTHFPYGCASIIRSISIRRWKETCEGARV